MLTEKVKSKIEKEKIESGIIQCKEIISKAEKYERLKDNKDWQEYLNDLKILGELHEKQIKVGVQALVDAPNSGHVKREMEKDVYVSSKQDWLDFILRHQIQMMECDKWIKEPERILTLAKMSRDHLPKLESKLKEFSSEAVENGKS